jgi:hypothetical protein
MKYKILIIFWYISYTLKTKYRGLEKKSSIMAIESFLNHFIFQILDSKFLFLAKFLPVRKSLDPPYRVTYISSFTLVSFCVTQFLLQEISF